MSPVVLRSGKFQVVIYVHDHTPPHVHVFSAGKNAKINLDPVRVVENVQFNRRELRQAVQLIEENRTLLQERWDTINPIS